MRKPKSPAISERHVDVADGLRALFIFFIAWYHIWQQSWLNPNLTIGSFTPDIYPLVRTGYLWVDGMLLLSGFLTFLPYARAMHDGTPLPDPWTFYKKRIARILPAYLFSVLTVLLFDALPNHAYGSTAELLRDLLPHLTFTHTFNPYSYFNTHLNVVLWTLAIEVQFYLIFPLLARAFAKAPLPTWLGMVTAAFTYRWYVTEFVSGNAIWINQLIAFMDIYALGFLGAWMYVALARSLKPNTAVSIFMTAVAFLALFGLWHCVLRQHYIGDYEALRVMQMRNRFTLGALLLMLILSLTWSFSAVRRVLSCRVLRFLSGVSFQFYIWHQYLAVLLRRLNIPYSASAVPNQDGELLWQWKYTLLAFAVALVAAVLVTYGIEKPCQRLILTGSIRNPKRKQKASSVPPQTKQKKRASR